MQGQPVAGKRATGHLDDLFVYSRTHRDEFTTEPVDRRTQARARSSRRLAKRKCYFFFFFL